MKTIEKWKSIVISLGGPAINLATAWLANIAFYWSSGGASPIKGGTQIFWDMLYGIIAGMSSLFASSLQVFEAAVGRSVEVDIVTASTGGQIVEETMAVAGLVPTLFGWVGVISVSLGVLNLIPIPPLDGFHVVSKIIDSIVNIRKPDFKFSDTKIITYIGAATLGYLVLFQLAVMWIDVVSIPLHWLALLIGVGIGGKFASNYFTSKKEVIPT